MKKFALMLAAAAAVFAVAGCVSYNTSDAATLSPQVGADHPGYEAQLDVKNTRVKGEATVTVLFGIFASGTDGYADRTSMTSTVFVPALPVALPELPNPSMFVKEAAVYNTCKAHNIDQLVAARYEIKTVDFFLFKTLSCKVEGYPAKAIGVKQKKAYVTPTGKIVWLADAPTVLAPTALPPTAPAPTAPAPTAPAPTAPAPTAPAPTAPAPTAPAPTASK